MKSKITATVFIFLSFLVHSCGVSQDGGSSSPGVESGTRTGSPLVDLQIEFFSSEVLKDVSVALCLSGIHLYQGDNISFSRSFGFSGTLVELSTSEALSSLKVEKLGIPAGSYSQVAFSYSSSCKEPLAYVFNPHGEFATNENADSQLKFDMTSSLINIDGSRSKTLRINVLKFLGRAREVEDEKKLPQLLDGTYSGV